MINSTRLRCAGYVVRMKEVGVLIGCAYKSSTSKPTGKRPLGRPRRRLEDTFRMDLKEIGISTRNWVDLAQDRDHWRAVDAALNLRVP